jgi:hypothetical protein
MKGTTGPGETGEGRAHARDLGCWVERTKGIEPSLRAWEAPGIQVAAGQTWWPTARDCALLSRGRPEQGHVEGTDDARTGRVEALSILVCRPARIRPSGAKGSHAAKFPRCLRLRARDPHGALDYMQLGSPHTDIRWQPYRVLGVGLTGEHRLTAGVRGYRLGRVAATGCTQATPGVGRIVCSTTASSSTESASRSTCSRRRPANASTVRAAS